MVAIVEKLMPQNYYTYGLAAAQADQVHCLSVCLFITHNTLSGCNERFGSR